MLFSTLDEIWGATSDTRTRLEGGESVLDTMSDTNTAQTCICSVSKIRRLKKTKMYFGYVLDTYETFGPASILKQTY